MKRFYATLAAFAVFAMLAFVLRAPALLAAAGALFAVAVGLGVAVPQLCFFAHFICRGKTGGKKQVALTFDDGPDPRSTPQLLTLLRERKVPAAFFAIGADVDANPELAARIAREGHLLENHSYTHNHRTNFYPPGLMLRELDRTQTAIEKTAGRAPRYYRPPNGLSNSWTHGVMRRTSLRLVAWTIRSFDTAIASPEKIVARITRRLVPGAIILLHDGGVPAEKLTATTSLLLDELRARGYEVARLDELLGDADRGG